MYSRADGMYHTMGGPSLLSMVLTNAGERRPGYEAQWPEYGSLLYRVTRPVGNTVCLATNKWPHFRSSGDKFVHDHLLMKFQRLLHWLHCHLPLPPGHLPHPHSTAHFETTSKAQGGVSIVCCSSDQTGSDTGGALRSWRNWVRNREVRQGSNYFNYLYADRTHPNNLIIARILDYVT